MGTRSRPSQERGEIMKNENNLVSVALHPVDVIPLLNMQLNPTQFLSRIVGHDIPADAEVVNISMDSWNYRIAVILRHSSFPETPTGGQIPQWPHVMECEAIQIPDEIRDFLNPQHGWKDAPDCSGCWHMCRLYLPLNAKTTPVQHHEIINVFDHTEMSEDGPREILLYMEFGDNEPYRVNRLTMHETPPGCSPPKFKLISRPPFPDISHDSITPLSE